MSRAHGKHSPRPPELSPERKREYGIDDRDIPGGKPHLGNKQVLEQQLTAAEPLGQFRGMMAHGVPPAEYGLHDREHHGKAYQPHFEQLREPPSPVPVYLVQRSGRGLKHTAMKHFQAPPIGSEPVQICGQDTSRSTVRLLNEGLPSAATVQSVGISSPALGASLIYRLPYSAQVLAFTATYTAGAAAGNRFPVFNYLDASGNIVAAISWVGAGIAPSTADVAWLAVGGTQQINAVNNSWAPLPSFPVLPAGYQLQIPIQNAGDQISAIRVLLQASAAGVRIGQLNDLAVDAQNSLIVGGAILPNAMAGYLPVETEGPLYAVSMDSGTPVISVIIETEIAGAG